MEEADINELLSVKSIKMEHVDENGFTTSEVVIPESLSDMPQFVTEVELGLIHSGGEILQTPLAVFCDPTEDEDIVESCDSGEEVIVQIMDIRTKLSKLKQILEQRLGNDLTDYTFWLQDAKMLESHKTLVEQCIRGEGEVQVNIQVRPLEKKINILDVLKPDEEVVQLADIDPECEMEEQMEDVVEAAEEEEVVPVAEETVVHAAALRWVVDEQFKNDRARLNIPNDPAKWSVHHVKLWIQWAVRHFKLNGVKLQNWSVSGETLVQLTHAEFKEKIPKDPGDLFWTHFELLRKCKFVAVVQQDEPLHRPPDMEIMPQCKKRPKQGVLSEVSNAQVVRGNNGQIQLWQFLLELLTSPEYINIIKWNGIHGEFKLLQPEKVAALWGARKHKPAMNYEKLSRALRYYYDGDMIAKVSGRSFVYKFVCDLRQLIGYDAEELSVLVAEAFDRMTGISDDQIL